MAAAPIRPTLRLERPVLLVHRVGSGSGHRLRARRVLALVQQPQLAAADIQTHAAATVAVGVLAGQQHPFEVDLHPLVQLLRGPLGERV